MQQKAAFEKTQTGRKIPNARAPPQPRNGSGLTCGMPSNKPTPRVLNVSLESLKLQENGEGCLLGEIEIAGVPFHVEAVEATDDGRMLLAENEELQNRIDCVGQFDDGSRYQTVPYRGKRYFVVIFPNQE